MYRYCQVSIGSNVSKEDKMDKLLLKPMEVAEMLGLGRSRTYEMLAVGELPSIRIGKSIRIPVKDLDEWIAERQGQQDDGLLN